MHPINLSLRPVVILETCPLSALHNPLTLQVIRKHVQEQVVDDNSGFK